MLDDGETEETLLDLNGHDGAVARGIIFRECEGDGLGFSVWKHHIGVIDLIGIAATDDSAADTASVITCLRIYPCDFSIYSADRGGIGQKIVERKERYKV